MKIFHLIAVFMCVSAIHAETLKLRYATSVIVFDDAGKRIGTRTLKAGTVIDVPEIEATSLGDKSGTLKPSNVAPAVFVADKIAKPTTFLAKVKLEGDSPIASFLLKTHWCCYADIYGKRTSSRKSEWCYVDKKQPSGKKVYSIISDGGEHTVLMTVHYEKRHDAELDRDLELVFIDDMQLVPGKKSVYDILPD